MQLVIEPVALILIVDMTFGINHLALAFSFAILQIPGVKTPFLVLLYSMIQLTAALILSIIRVLLVIGLLGVALPSNYS